MDFCRRYRISHLVVEEGRFAPEFIARGAFFAPYDDLIRELARGAPGFAVLEEDFGQRSRVGPGIWLVDVRSPTP